MAKNTEEPKGLVQVIVDALKELKETAVAFAKAPKALWGVNIPYVFEGLIYFGILTILGKYCSENVGMSDLHAGWVYSGVTAGITLAMLFLGGISDKIGVRKALILAFGLFLAGRALISLSGTLPLGHGVASPMFAVLVLGLLCCHLPTQTGDRTGDPQWPNVVDLCSDRYDLACRIDPSQRLDAEGDGRKSHQLSLAGSISE